MRLDRVSSFGVSLESFLSLSTSGNENKPKQLISSLFGGKELEDLIKQVDELKAQLQMAGEQCSS